MHQEQSQEVIWSLFCYQGHYLVAQKWEKNSGGFLMIMKRLTFEKSPNLAIIRGRYLIQHPLAVVMVKRII